MIRNLEGRLKDKSSTLCVCVNKDSSSRQEVYSSNFGLNIVY